MLCKGCTNMTHNFKARCDARFTEVRAIQQEHLPLRGRQLEAGMPMAREECNRSRAIGTIHAGRPKSLEAGQPHPGVLGPSQTVWPFLPHVCFTSHGPPQFRTCFHQRHLISFSNDSVRGPRQAWPSPMHRGAGLSQTAAQLGNVEFGFGGRCPKFMSMAVFLRPR